jgi:hypothetical protein
MKSLKSNSAAPLLDVDAPAAVADIYLEVEPQGYGEFLRLPAHVKELTEAGVILEVPDLPSEVRAESLVDQIGIVHVPSDGFSPATQLRATVGGCRPGGNGPAPYLLGLDLHDVDARGRQALAAVWARPKDMTDLWRYWDQVQLKPAARDSRFIFCLCAAAVLGGLALQFVLPEAYQSLANILILSGSIVIAGACLWHWRRERSLSGSC